MDLLLLHLGVGGNKSNGSVSPRDVRVCRASQADLKMVQGQSIETFSLQNGIVESDVIFTLAAAAEIRNSIQSPVDPRTGISVENARSEGSKTKGQFVASANRSSIPTNKTFPAAEQSPLKSKDTYNDGTMSDSDSSDSFDSSRNMSRLNARRKPVVNGHTNESYVMTVRNVWQCGLFVWTNYLCV
jgi:hypothetical protein